MKIPVGFKYTKKLKSNQFFTWSNNWLSKSFKDPTLWVDDWCYKAQQYTVVDWG